MWVYSYLNLYKLIMLKHNNRICSIGGAELLIFADTQSENNHKKM